MIKLDVIRSHREDFEGFMRAKNAELDAAHRTLKELGRQPNPPGGSAKKDLHSRHPVSAPPH